MKFTEWYYNQTINQAPAIKKRIALACRLRQEHNGRVYTFENWLHGKSKVPPLAQEKINRIAKQRLIY